MHNSSNISRQVPNMAMHACRVLLCGINDQSCNIVIVVYRVQTTDYRQNTDHLHVLACAGMEKSAMFHRQSE